MIARFLLGALALSILTACEPFNRPVGADLDEGGFGNPTMQNIMAHRSAQRTNPIIYTVNAAQQRQAAAAPATPNTSLDPVAIAGAMATAAAASEN
ncbi:hypothetical protein OE810_12460 [Rhodobacteraceae bacterium XHP0102]|nr:hypothetical protein [Rhodobacteraceae bacterium XHP0102]